MEPRCCGAFLWVEVRWVCGMAAYEHANLLDLKAGVYLMPVVNQLRKFLLRHYDQADSNQISPTLSLPNLRGINFKLLDLYFFA